MFDWNVLRLVLSVIAALLHTFGFFALWRVKQHNPYLITQRLYLIQLSVSENAHSIFLAHYYAFKIVGNEEGKNYMMICCGGTFLWFLSVLIMLTLDRFCTVYLHTRYLGFWTRRRTKMVLLACFIVSVTANLIFLLTLPDLDTTLAVFSTYLWFPLEVFFIVLLTSIYAYISWRVLYYRKSAVKPIKNSPSHSFSQAMSPVHMYQRKKEEGGKEIENSSSLSLKKSSMYYDGSSLRLNSFKPAHQQNNGFFMTSSNMRRSSLQCNVSSLKPENIEDISNQNNNNNTKMTSSSAPNMRIELEQKATIFQNAYNVGVGNLQNEVVEKSCNIHQTSLVSRFKRDISIRKDETSTTTITTPISARKSSNAQNIENLERPQSSVESLQRQQQPSVFMNKTMTTSEITTKAGLVTSGVKRRQKIGTQAIRNHKKTILVPLWLITSFVVFIAIPDVGYFICVLLEIPRPFFLKVAAAFYPVGIISDALIYIFFVKEVRLFLIKKCREVLKRIRSI